jgi:hypothetical protein
LKWLIPELSEQATANRLVAGLSHKPGMNLIVAAIS